MPHLIDRPPPRLLTIKLQGATSFEMRTVGLKTLKNKLSEYVRLAAAGETVVVTDRNRVVAEIGPPRSREQESVIERGIREGWIRPAKRGADWPPPSKPVKGLTLEQLLKELDEDREDR